MIVFLFQRISLAFNAITVCLNLLHPKRREFPARLAIIFSIASLGFNTTICITNIVGYKNLVKIKHDENGNIITEPNSACILQSVLFTFFSNSMVIWWTMFVYTIYKLLCTQASIATQRLSERNYYFIWIIYSTFLTILPFAFGKYGPERGLPWCWMNKAEWKFYILHGEMGFAVVLGIFWGGQTIYRLAYLHKTNTLPLDLLRANIARNVFFLSAFFFIFAITFSWSINFLLWENGKSSMPFLFSALEMISVCSIGTIIFLILGFNKDNFILITSFVRRVFNLKHWTTNSEHGVEKKPEYSLRSSLLSDKNEDTYGFEKCIDREEKQRVSRVQHPNITTQNSCDLVDVVSNDSFDTLSTPSSHY